MPTSSFDREIILDELSVESLINIIESDKKSPLQRKRIDFDKTLKEGEEILERLFSKNDKDNND